MTPAPKRTTIRVAEIAARMGLGEMLVYRLLDEGEIPAIRLGRWWIISRTRFEQWEATFGGGKAA